MLLFSALNGLIFLPFKIFVVCEKASSATPKVRVYVYVSLVIIWWKTLWLKLFIVKLNLWLLLFLPWSTNFVCVSLKNSITNWLFCLRFYFFLICKQKLRIHISHMHLHNLYRYTTLTFLLMQKISSSSTSWSNNCDRKNLSPGKLCCLALYRLLTYMYSVIRFLINLLIILLGAKSKPPEDSLCFSFY